MPAAHFLGLRPRLVFAQYPDDLLLAEATPFHRPSPFSGDGLYLISAEFSGCRPRVRRTLAQVAEILRALFSVKVRHRDSPRSVLFVNISTIAGRASSPKIAGSFGFLDFDCANFSVVVRQTLLIQR